MADPLLQQTGATLREARRFIMFAALCFLGGILYGYFQPDRFQPLLASAYSLADRLRVASPLAVIGLIFLQNSTSALLAIWLGFLFGVIPLLGAVINGLLIGAMAAYLGREWQLLLAILPHGIFELPAIIIAWGLGLWRGLWPLATDRRQTYQGRARRSYRVFFTLILPLLVLAAIIEGVAIVLVR